MYRSLLLPVAALCLALGQGSVQAQPLNGVTQSPPAPNSQQGAPQPLNSLPRGSLTGATVAPGASLGGATPVASATPAVNTLQPLRQPRRAVHRRPAHRAAHRAVRPGS